MKFTLVLVLMLAVLANCKKRKNSDDSDEKPTCIETIANSFTRLEQSLAKNSALNDEVVAAFQKTRLAQYVVDVNDTKRINGSALARNYFSAVPQIAAILSVLSISNRFQDEILALNNSISQVQNIQLIENRLAGILFQNDLVNNIVAGCSPVLQINFNNLQRNAQGAEFLACYLTRNANNQRETNRRPKDRK